MDYTKAMVKPVEVSILLVELRARTKELHAQAERHPIQAAMIQGDIDTSGYMAYLGLMWHIHTALEAELARRASASALAQMTTDYFRAQAIIEDLHTLGCDKPKDSCPPVQAFAADIKQASEAELLGMHYVLEGSTNGGRYLAMAVRKGLGLQADAGTCYLDPHGKDQRASWDTYCTTLSQLTLDDAEQEAVVCGAESMFKLIIATLDTLL